MTAHHFTSAALAEAFAEEHKPARVTLDGKLVYEVTLLDQPTDAEVAEAIAVLELKPHHVPEGYASWNGNGKIRIHKPLPHVLDVGEVDAWVELLLKAKFDAEAAVEEKLAEEQDAGEHGEAA